MAVLGCRPARGGSEADLFAQLRRQRVYDLGGLRYVLYEAKSGLTVVPQSAGGREEGGEDPALVARGLEESAGF